MPPQRYASASRPILSESGDKTQDMTTTLPDYVNTAFTMLPFNSYSIDLSNVTTAEMVGVRKLEDIVSARTGANRVSSMRQAIDANDEPFSWLGK